MLFPLSPHDYWGPACSDECLGMWHRGEALAVGGDDPVCLLIVITAGVKHVLANTEQTTNTDRKSVV